MMGQYSTAYPQEQKDDGGTETSLEFHWLFVLIVEQQQQQSTKCKLILIYIDPHLLLILIRS